MNKVTEYYESVGDTLDGPQAERTYRAAQNHLIPSMSGYMEGLKRLQQKIIDSIK
jgi:hypothetical protein